MISTYKKLGPGLLYAAAAVGVSHLVQSTRAGAEFGFELIWVIIIAHILKYPFFWVVPNYVHQTKKNLLQAYSEIGSWALPLVLIMTFLTMFIIQAAITTVTAGLLINTFPEFDFSMFQASSIILGLSLLLLWKDKQTHLDSFIKVVIITLTITTILTVFSAINFEIPKVSKASFSFTDSNNILFLIAFIGWMPAPMDVPIWQSLWTQNKLKVNNDIKLARLDFNIGFFGTGIVAMLFLSLGAFVMYPQAMSFKASAVGFTSQLLDLYTLVIGSKLKYFLTIAAFATMFSTVITCLDAFPRVMSSGLDIKKPGQKKFIYKLFLILTVFVALNIQTFFIGNMKELVDFATSLSFILGPIYAYLNYKVLLKLERLPVIIKWLARLGIIFFIIFSIYYIKIKFI